MAETTDLAALVNRIPELDVAGERTGNKEQDDIRKRDENKLTGPKWAAAQEMFDTILRGGRDSIIALIDMLKEVDKGDDYKVRYVLHGLALYVCRPEKRGQRAVFIDALLSQIGGARAKAVWSQRSFRHGCRGLAPKSQVPLLPPKLKRNQPRQKASWPECAARCLWLPSHCRCLAQASRCLPKSRRVIWRAQARYKSYSCAE